MSFDHVALVILGVSGLASAWLARTGRWRWWAQDRFFRPFPITVAPTLGAVFLTSGLAPMLPEPVVTLLGATSLLSTMLAWVLGFAEPRWLGPRWYRERDRDYYDLSVYNNALMAATVSPSPEQSGELAVRRSHPGEPLLARRRACLLGPEWGRPSALHKEGVVSGRLLFYSSELVFAAEWIDDGLRGGPTVRRLPAGSITGVGLSRPARRPTASAVACRAAPPGAGC